MKLIEFLKDHLIGNAITHKNSHGRQVTLVVESVEVLHKSRQITESTPANDWWGESCEWDVISVSFADGSSVEMNLETEIEWSKVETIKP